MALPSTESSPTPTPAATEKVAILDCGAQYTKVIDRRVRELHIHSEILPLHTSMDSLQDYHAIILSGGPNSVFADDAPAFNPELLTLGIPVLGICYGMQLIAHHMGGTVVPGTHKEYGETRITVDPKCPLFHTLTDTQMVLMSHGDKVTQLPPGFEQTASSDNIVAGIAHADKQLYGVQFHPEVELSEQGHLMLKNFLYDIAGLSGSYDLSFRLDEIIADIQRTVGDGSVFTLVSGGVDSAVTTALLLKALGPDHVYALHVDTGFMRHQESELVCQALESLGLKHLQHLKAASDFLNATTDIDGTQVGPLNTVTDPEEKRRIIGDTFFHLTQQAMTALNLDLDTTFIAQGTLRPDLIESGNTDVSDVAHKIKTHHNDVPLIQEQREKGLIIETNRNLHKDEVRHIGLMLGLPEAIVQRQPFPGPGLAIRVLCTTLPVVSDSHVQLTETLQHTVSPHGLTATVLPVQSVGVQGDFRSYRQAVALSPLSNPDWEQLKSLATHIPNTQSDINRVIICLNTGMTLPEHLPLITSTTLNTQVLELLRQVDHQVTTTLTHAGVMSKLSQLLCVLIPVDWENQQRHSIVIRAVVTSDFMTARAARLGEELPWEIMQPLADAIVKQHPIAGVFYDLTSKPPGTVEWE